MKMRLHIQVGYNVILLLALVAASFVFKDTLLNISLPDSRCPTFLTIAIFGQFIFWVLASSAWVIGVKRFSSLELGILRGFAQCNAVAVGKYLPGKIWGLVSRGIDLKRQGLSGQHILLVNYLDQVLLLHAGVLFGAIAYFHNANKLAFVIVICISILSVVAIPLSHSSIYFMLKNVLHFKKIKYLFKQVSLYNYILLIIIYMLVWLIAGVIFSCIYFWLYGFNMHLFFVLIGANTIGIIFGFMAFFAPGGIGVREATSIAILINHMPHEQALVLVVVYRAWTVLTDISGGISALILLRVLDRRPIVQ